MKVSARLIAIEILAFVAFVILAGAGLLAWRLSQGPIDLEMFRGQVERSLAEARGGQPVTIEKLGLEWVRDRGRVEAVARGFTAMDKERHVTFQADRAMIALDAGALFGLKLKAQHLRLENGNARVVRSADGVWTLADMVIAKEPDASSAAVQLLFRDTIPAQRCSTAQSKSNPWSNFEEFQLSRDRSNRGTAVRRRGNSSSEVI